MKRCRNSLFAYSGLYFLYFATLNCSSCLLTVYLLGLGFLPSRVALAITACNIISAFFNPVSGVLQSKYSVKKVSGLMLIIAAAGTLVMVITKDLLVISVGYVLVHAPLFSIQMTMENLATASPYDYGKTRIFGTIGSAVGMQVAGIVYDAIAPWAVFVTSAIFALLTTYFLSLIDTKVTDKDNSDKTEKGTGDAKVMLSSVFKNKVFLLYLVIHFFLFGAADSGHVYCAPMLQNDGMSVSLTSTMLFIASMIEIVIVVTASKFMDKLSNNKLLIIGSFALFAEMVSYSLDAALPIKLGFTFLVKHADYFLLTMTSLKIVSSVVKPHEKVAALSICQGVKSLANIIVVNICGRILDTSTYAQMFSVCVVLAGIAFILSVIIKLPEGPGYSMFQTEAKDSVNG